jgi:hypothetical protein
MGNTPLFDERKAAEAAAFMLFKAGGKLPLIKLVKLLYLAERLSLQRYGEPLTGDRLVAMPNGPVLSITYDHMNGALPSREGGWESWIADRAGHEVALRDPSKLRTPEQDLLRLSDSDSSVTGTVGNSWSTHTPPRVQSGKTPTVQVAPSPTKCCSASWATRPSKQPPWPSASTRSARSRHR